MKRAALLAIVLCVPLARAQTEASEETAEPTITPARVAAALERYADEPRIDELLAALDRHPALDVEEARRLARRSRRGGWLPQVRLGVRRGQQRDLQTQIEEDSTRVSADDDLTLEASVTLRLDRAAYGQDELSTLREIRQRASLRDDRAHVLVDAYFERRRLQLERDLLGHQDLATELRIAELAALMDALTRGAWTRMTR